MIKYRYIFAPVVLVILGLLIWRTFILFTNLPLLFLNEGTSSELSTKTTRQEETVSLIKPSHIANNSNFGHYETIEETITRLKQDVIVTGTILGIPGEESALFQIEGMADRLFKVNTQLMDGFIIKEITKSAVVLKNQQGSERFSLLVKRGS